MACEISRRKSTSIFWRAAMANDGYEAAQKFLSDLNSKLTLEEWNLGGPVPDFLKRYNIHPHTWERVQKHLQRERLRAEKDAVRNDLTKIQKSIKEREIDELIAGRFQGAQKDEVRWIKSRILNEVDAWDNHYDEEYTLAKMLDEGLPGIRKQMRGKRFRWRYISWAWAVLINLFVILVALAIYGHVTTAFETIVVSLLIILYLSVIGGQASWGQLRNSSFMPSYIGT